MKATINVEFTDDELRKYAEDVARRIGLNVIHDVIGHLGAVKHVAPGTFEAVEQALVSAIATGTKTGQPGPMPSASEPAPFEPPALDRCLRIEANQNSDESWICCKCDALNGVHRAACRLCGHGRCDVVVPPPPSPRETDPSVQ